MSKAIGMRQITYSAGLKDSFGWVKAESTVDHPSAKQRDGKLYVSKKENTLSVWC